MTFGARYITSHPRYGHHDDYIDIVLVLQYTLYEALHHTHHLVVSRKRSKEHKEVTKY